MLNLFQIAHVCVTSWRKERQHDRDDPSHAAQDLGHHQVQAVSGKKSEQIFPHYLNR
jgi:hypothetical protein